MDTARREFGINAADEVGGACAEVEIHLALAEALGQSLVAERDRLHLDRAGQGSQHYIGALRDLAGRVGPLRAHLQVRCGGLAPDVMDDEVVPAAYRIQRHRAAHCSKSDKSYVHGCLPLSIHPDRNYVYPVVFPVVNRRGVMTQQSHRKLLSILQSRVALHIRQPVLDVLPGSVV